MGTRASKAALFVSAIILALAAAPAPVLAQPGDAPGSNPLFGLNALGGAVSAIGGGTVADWA